MSSFGSKTTLFSIIFSFWYEPLSERRKCLIWSFLTFSLSSVSYRVWS